MTTYFTYIASIIAILFTISLITTFHIAKAQTINVTRGSSLTPTGDDSTKSWLSPSGIYAFGFYPQTHGYDVGIYFNAGIPPERTVVVWTANRDTLPLSNNATLRFTNDGRLTLDQTPGQEINIFDSNGDASFASMQDSGNFVIYGSQGRRVLWQSFDHPTDSLLAGQRLVAGQTLYSSVSLTDQSTGIFKLSMQGDGNLVQHPNLGTQDGPNNAYWDSSTNGAGPNVTLNLDSGGFLYLKNSTGVIKNLNRSGDYPIESAIYQMRIDVDGILRLYYYDLRNTSNNGSVIWESSTNKCTGNGLCGVNGYCVSTNDTAQCRCLPGFEFVNPEFWSQGCHRKYIGESCNTTGSSTSIRMTNLNNASWEEATYLIPKALTQEECSFVCMNDCKCEVALFKYEKECRFQRLPLRFIKLGEDVQDVALIKVYTSLNNGLDPSNPFKKVRQMKILVVGVSLISFAIVILFLSGTLIFCRRAQVFGYKSISRDLNIQLFEDIGPRAFSYGELERITDCFKEELGRGSFGIVYKGIIESSNNEVAVKKLKVEWAQQGETEFQNEMKVIGRTHHRNLARLLGYCCEGPERLLVFELMTKGSLADVLFEPKESMSKPPWTERIKMAIDIARGILYLHEECEKTIIHCDIKPQNILMDEYNCAKISDFGLAKLLEHDQSRTSTMIRGTRGYVAPEWHKKLPITTKVDVYSYGIVFFNILCCRRNVDNSLPAEEAILAEWVYDCYEANEVQKLVGDEDIDKEELEKMVRIGLWCIQEEPSLRPSIKKVLLMLEGKAEIPIPSNPISLITAV